MKVEKALTEFTYSNQRIRIEGYHVDDLIFDRIVTGKTFYEEKLLEKARSLNLEGVYVDVGANIGNHSIFFSRFCSSTLVYSFEIDEKIFALLKKNMENNCSEDTYHLKEIGILDKKGFVDLSETNHLNAGMTKIVNVEGTQKKVNTLDNLLEKVKNIVLIKIDVEGLELEIINGAQKILEDQSPVIFAELATDTEFKLFKNELSKYGYTTDNVNYAAPPTYLFQKNNSS
jgi:protein O-GlcNAc transferase